MCGCWKLHHIRIILEHGFSFSFLFFFPHSIFLNLIYEGGTDSVGANKRWSVRRSGTSPSISDEELVVSVGCTAGRTIGSRRRLARMQGTNCVRFSNIIQIAIKIFIFLYLIFSFLPFSNIRRTYRTRALATHAFSFFVHRLLRSHSLSIQTPDILA